MAALRASLLPVLALLVFALATSAAFSLSSDVAAPRLRNVVPSRCSVAMRSAAFSLRLRGGEEDEAKDVEAKEDEDDLFGDDAVEDVAAAEARKAKAAEAQEKAAGKKKEEKTAKTNVILDVKAWGDETDMAALEASVRKIEMDGLLWGASGLEEVGYGIKKLRITVVVEDDKVSIDELEEKIKEDEEHVQSVDVVTMSKI